MYENRIKHLEEEHRALHKKVEALERSGVFGDVSIEDLKKQKLHLKDEISRLKRLQEENTKKP